MDTERAAHEPVRAAGRRRVIEWLKNLLIILLSCTAVYLAARSRLFDGLGGSWVGAAAQLLGVDSTAVSSSGSDPAAARMRVQPGAIAFCTGVDLGGGVYERCGIQYDSAALDRAFDEVSRFLGEALAGADTPRQVSEEQWREALQSPGVYFDLLGSSPLCALTVWLVGQSGEQTLSGSARRLALTVQDAQSVVLYYINEEDGLYYACETSVPVAGGFEALIAGRSANGAFFTFEGGEEYADFDPWLLLAGNTYKPAAYLAANPIAPEDEEQRAELQNALSFRPDGYLSGDDWVNDTLRIGHNGIVRYDGRRETYTRYAVGRGLDADNPAQAVSAARALAEVLLTFRQEQEQGDLRLYLAGLDRTEDGLWEIQFGCLLNGCPVLLDGQPECARFLVGDGRIQFYELHFRHYTALASGTPDAPILPTAQAAAVALSLSPDGRELMLCYLDDETDSADGTLRASWVVR